MRMTIRSDTFPNGAAFSRWLGGYRDTCRPFAPARAGPKHLAWRVEGHTVVQPELVETYQR